MWLRLSSLKMVGVLFLLKWCAARMIASPRQARLTVAESIPSYHYRNIDGHPDTYAFGYDITDPVTGNRQFRTEERYPNGTVVGSYGYVNALGVPYRYTYVADGKGYRVKQDLPHYRPQRTTTQAPLMTTEETVSWTRPSKNKNKRPVKSNDNRRNYINSLNNADNYVKDFYF